MRVETVFLQQEVSVEKARDGGMNEKEREVVHERE
jgi:hypothetical protein